MKSDHWNVESASSDHYGLMKGYARFNRCLPTDAEYVLWQCLRRSQLGVRFRRQHAIYDYVADFVCMSENLIIEVDGDYHFEEEQMNEDFLRQQKLESLGYRVLRFTNDEVLNKTEEVLQIIQSNV